MEAIEFGHRCSAECHLGRGKLKAMFAQVRSWWRAATRRRGFEGSMSAELGFHIDRYTEDLMRAGATHEEAYRRARMELGGLNSLKENCREAHGRTPVNRSRSGGRALGG